MPLRLHPTRPHDHPTLARRGVTWAAPLALVIPCLAVGALGAQADPAVPADVSAATVPTDPAPNPMTSTPASPTTAATTDPPTGCYPPPAASAPATGSPQPVIPSPEVWPNPGAPVTADFSPAVQIAGGIATLRVDTSGAGLYPPPCGEPVIPTVVAKPSVPAGLTDATGGTATPSASPTPQPSVSAGSTDTTGGGAIHFVQDPSDPYVYTASVTANPASTTTYTLPIAVYPNGPGGLDPVVVTATVTFVPTGPPCDAPMWAKMSVTPHGPLPVGSGADSTYTIKVTQVIDPPTCAGFPEIVHFWVTSGDELAGNQVRLGADSCVPDLSGSCSVTVTSPTPGTFAIHASITDPATGALTEIAGNSDPSTNSPQEVTWTSPVINPWTTLLQQLQLLLQQLLALLRNLFVLPVPLKIA